MNLALCCIAGGAIMLLQGKLSLVPLGLFMGLVFGGLGLSLRGAFVAARAIPRLDQRVSRLVVLTVGLLAFSVVAQWVLGWLVLFALFGHPGDDALFEAWETRYAAAGAALLAVVLNLKSLGGESKGSD
ncbi:MAG: hypothetical protein HY321_21690 [Armatimonadetes bacterium]|nr:hypothetical protein [Armatimonadota bacterium]